MKYLIYLRVSTERQDNRTQLDHCLEYLKSRVTGHFDYKVYWDIKTSRKGVFKRAGSSSMLQEAQEGDIIIAHRLDRLSRISSQAHALIDHLDERKIGIQLVDQQNLSNKIMLGIYAGMAEEEVKLIRKRVKDKFESKKRRGERTSGVLPYGFGLHPKKMVPIQVGDKIVLKPGILVPHDQELAVVGIMLELYGRGYSLQNICNELTQRGHFNREGNPFQKMTVSRIIKRVRSGQAEVDCTELAAV